MTNEVMLENLLGDLAILAKKYNILLVSAAYPLDDPNYAGFVFHCGHTGSEKEHALCTQRTHNAHAALARVNLLPPPQASNVVKLMDFDKTKVN